jgi:hypothetical protein
MNLPVSKTFPTGKLIVFTLEYRYRYEQHSDIYTEFGLHQGFGSTDTVLTDFQPTYLYLYRHKVTVLPNSEVQAIRTTLQVPVALYPYRYGKKYDYFLRKRRQCHFVVLVPYYLDRYGR